jgi:hypothetical protein
MVPLLTKVTPLGQTPSITSAAVDALVEETVTPLSIVSCTCETPSQPKDSAKVLKFILF